MLSRVLLMEQASFLDSAVFDFGSPFDDGCVAPEVGIGGRDVVEALVVAVVVVMIDEFRDAVFEIAGQVVVLQQDPVLEGLMPTLDLALCLGMIWRATDVPYWSRTGRSSRMLLLLSPLVCWPRLRPVSPVPRPTGRP